MQGMAYCFINLPIRSVPKNWFECSIGSSSLNKCKKGVSPAEAGLTPFGYTLIIIYQISQKISKDFLNKNHIGMVGLSFPLLRLIKSLANKNLKIVLTAGWIKNSCVKNVNRKLKHTSLSPSATFSIEPVFLICYHIVRCGQRYETSVLLCSY